MFPFILFGVFFLPLIVWYIAMVRFLPRAMMPAAGLLNVELGKSKILPICEVAGSYRGRNVWCVPYSGNRGAGYHVTMQVSGFECAKIFEEQPELKKKYFLTEDRLYSRVANYECSGIFLSFRKLERFNQEKLGALLEDMYQNAQMLEQKAGE